MNKITYSTWNTHTNVAVVLRQNPCISGTPLRLSTKAAITSPNLLQTSIPVSIAFGNSATNPYKVSISEIIGFQVNVLCYKQSHLWVWSIPLTNRAFLCWTICKGFMGNIDHPGTKRLSMGTQLMQRIVKHFLTFRDLRQRFHNYVCLLDRKWKSVIKIFWFLFAWNKLTFMFCSRLFAYSQVQNEENGSNIIVSDYDFTKIIWWWSWWWW